MFLVNFMDYAKFDGVKYFLKIVEKDGDLTLMQYQDGSTTCHRKFKTFWDVKEWEVDSDFIYWNRRAINLHLKMIGVKR
ncbi:hypothetical protein [Mangrovibacillus cuniculi]|uniref:Uncharacterized protein n=1 Tax=Mangrovibacillus cuniculi TaxID=2593652 RepID=A0A7S8HFN2_9BACI|nr:hypothetical protein [Mangrovibacillus cuniculi]QPC47089.1 hypothetical protein G8O30_08980 [Mangrovibacillus cuniculi]QPC48504.1 hypothetical protein G8O30_15980 [Mangrovibacillus cuniculi]